MALLFLLLLFFFKQKTAYEMRISDWSSDVCSSDLQPSPGASRLAGLPRLTFVTHEARLKARIGGAADQSFDLIRASGHQLVDLVTDMTPFDVARLASGSAGVVILGGYSVIPALSVDTLPPRRSEEHTSELQSLMRI